MSLREQLKKLNLGMRRKEVYLSPHNADWSKAFVVTNSILIKELTTDIELHHIGSTAISGIRAKPILDSRRPCLLFDSIDSTIRS